MSDSCSLVGYIPSLTRGFYCSRLPLKSETQVLWWYNLWCNVCLFSCVHYNVSQDSVNVVCCIWGPGSPTILGGKGVGGDCLTRSGVVLIVAWDFILDKCSSSSYLTCNYFGRSSREFSGILMVVFYVHGPELLQDYRKGHGNPQSLHQTLKHTCSDDDMFGNNRQELGTGKQAILCGGGLVAPARAAPRSKESNSRHSCMTLCKEV